MQIEETVLDQIRSRPRFKIITEIRREEYTAFLKRFLTEKSHEFSGNINNETAVITVKNNQNEYWKPNLSLRTETDEENKTVIRGVFGQVLRYGLSSCSFTLFSVFCGWYLSLFGLLKSRSKAMIFRGHLPYLL